jgi:hypothetical protein
MKILTFVAAAVALGAAVAPSLAFDGAALVRSRAPLVAVSCDTHADDDQAQCASNCEDKYVRGKQHNMTDQTANEEEKKACDAKCGCPQNSK